VFGPKEFLVFTCLIENGCNKSAAQKLNISYSTVRTHWKNIYKKIGVKNIAELINWHLDYENN